jgi:hypothetical protein
MSHASVQVTSWKWVEIYNGERRMTMPNNMTAQEKMALTMTVFNNIFASKANGVDIVTIRIVHPNIVNGKPILNQAGQRVGGEVNGRWFKDSTTGQQTLRGFDIDVQTDNKILQLRFIEQNPNKVDNYGNLKPMANAARRGSKIMWLIDRRQQVNGFLGRVQDGVFHPSQDRAVAPVAKATPAPVVPQPVPNVQAQVASQDPNDEESADELPWEEESVPDLPDMGIPEYVMKYYEDMEPGDEAEFGEFK